MKKKKILFVLWSFSLGGGAEKILATICNNLDLDKYDIDILELEHFDKPFPKLDSRVKILKSWQDYKQPRILRALLWRIRRFFPIFTRRMLVKDIYDVEISFTIINPYFPFSKRENVKKIAWIHGSIEAFKSDEVKRENHRKGLKKVDKIVSISQKTKDSIIEIYPEYVNKVVNIYNGYDFNEIIDKSNEEVDTQIFENSICVIGRIEELKGSMECYEVLKNLHLKHKKYYHLYYIGSGELKNDILNQSRRDGLENYVHFLGYQNNPHKYLNKMKVLLSMSKQEGFSGAMVEALVLRKPFVSTDVGGVKEISNNGMFGKIIYNEEQASEEIINYIENNFENSSAMEYISKFTIDNQIKKIEEILGENNGY